MTLLQAAGRPGAPDASVWLRIEDEGPGIEREHLPRLGERFYRADQSRGGKITGTGRGLAIVKHIMAHHRGGLAVETRLGGGQRLRDLAASGAALGSHPPDDRLLLAY
jgi:two-component system, OmpR family, phosphate regulon sensor histidine kinase PhoR